MPIWLIKSTPNSLTTHLDWVLVIIIFLFALTNIKGQEQVKESAPFVNISGGFGNIYGGYGTNAELGSGHFALYGTFGYANERVIDTIRLNSTFNYQLGLRYYFNVGSEVLFPRIGFGYGWVTNYYNEQIGNVKYDQTVFGINMHVGTQVYSAEGFIFSFDINVASKYTISNENRHPFFYSLYVRPNIGIGYDLTRLFSQSKHKRHIKNKAINPFE